MTHKRALQGQAFVACVVLVYVWLSSASAAVTVERFASNPLVSKELFPNGGFLGMSFPSVIRKPSWIQGGPLKQYLMYAGEHRNNRTIFLFHADNITGPWSQYLPGTVKMVDIAAFNNDTLFEDSHIASPDVRVDFKRSKIVMVFHYEMVKSGHRSAYAVSSDGVNFQIENGDIGDPYIRQFFWDKDIYIIDTIGDLYRSRNGLPPYEYGGPAMARAVDDRAIKADVRHIGLVVKNEHLYLFFTRINDGPERIFVSRVPLKDKNWRCWKGQAPVEVMRAVEDYEGGNLPPTPSGRGDAPTPVNQLRDPYLFVDEDGKEYLFYAHAGEQGISGAEIVGQEEETQGKPNVVLIVAGEVSTRLGSRSFMPLAHYHLAEEGATLERFYVNTASSSPSRATYLTGLYEHNHGVQANSGDFGGFQRFLQMGNDERTIATIMKERGYTTGFIGRHMTQYNVSLVGTKGTDWDEWFVIADSSSSSTPNLMNSCFSDNGQLRCYAASEGVYQTDVLANRSVQFISANKDKPFFLFVSPQTPDAMTQPAPRHASLYPDLKNPRTPHNYQIHQVRARRKPYYLASAPRITDAQEVAMDRAYRSNMLSLLAVDELVDRVVRSLESNRIIGSTYIMFTAASGFHSGQQRLPVGNKQAYEEDVLVPMFIRGPAIERGLKVQSMASAVDVFPTLAELTGAQTPADIDGISFAKILTRSRDDPNCNEADDDTYPTRDIVFFEHHAETGISWAAAEPNSYAAARVHKECVSIRKTVNVMYNKWWTGEAEFYDMNNDPYQTGNILADTTVTDPVAQSLDATVELFRNCSGASCRLQSVAFFAQC